MILVTVGMQLGFDRLIRAMDEISPTLDQKVIAQTGKGKYVARSLEQHEMIAPAEFEKLVSDAMLIVSHAGIGTILSAKRSSKPIVIFPRRAELGEHRNNHQLATCRQLAGREGIYAAFEEEELSEIISVGLKSDLSYQERAPATSELENAVRRFIEAGKL